MNQFDWHITQKKMKLWRLPKIEGPILKYRVPPIWLTYIDEMSQSIWDKSEALWRTCWGTHWELKRNIVGTHCEPGKMGKKSFPTPPPPPRSKTLKEQKQGTLSACLGLPIGCMKFSLPKRVEKNPLQRTPTLPIIHLLT
jgi:hypothetical protein